MTTVGWRVGDTAPPLTGVCWTDTTASPRDLSAVTSVDVHVAKPDGTVISRAATTANADGTWSLDWQTGDLDVAGQYVVEVEVTGLDGITTYPDNINDSGARFTVSRALA